MKNTRYATLPLKCYWTPPDITTSRYLNFPNQATELTCVLCGFFCCGFFCCINEFSPDCPYGCSAAPPSRLSSPPVFSAMLDYCAALTPLWLPTSTTMRNRQWESQRNQMHLPSRAADPWIQFIIHHQMVVRNNKSKYKIWNIRIIIHPLCLPKHCDSHMIFSSRVYFFRKRDLGIVLCVHGTTDSFRVVGDSDLKRVWSQFWAVRFIVKLFIRRPKRSLKRFFSRRIIFCCEESTPWLESGNQRINSFFVCLFFESIHSVN